MSLNSNMKKKSSLRLYVEGSNSKSNLTLKQIDIKKYLSKREYKKWEKLPDDSKEKYLAIAQKTYIRKQQSQQNNKRLLYVEKERNGGNSSRASNATNSADKKSDGKSKDTMYGDFDNKGSTLRSNVIFDNAYGNKTERVSKPSGNSNVPVVKQSEVISAAKEIGSSASSLAEKEIKQAEARENAAQKDSINKQIAKLYQEDLKGAKKTIGTVVNTALPQLKTAMVAAAPFLMGFMLLMIVMVGAIGGVVAAAGKSNESSGGKRIVEVALAEDAEGPHTGGEKYWRWYGFSSRVEWCATFVSWCADQCGYIDSGIFPKSASVSAYRDWYQAKGLYQEKADYTPKAGDLIIFKNGMSHIGIVQYVEGGQVVTVEGNAGDQVKQVSYPLDYSGISGYCTPEYPSSEFTGDTNAEITWNFLLSKGCTPEVAAGIMGNLQQESGIDPTKHQSGGGVGRGICQWTVGSGRFVALEAKAAEMGMSWDNIEPQLEHMWDELSGGEATCKKIMDRDYGGFDNFIKSKDIEWACLAFEKSFERAGRPMMEKRYQYAHAFYAQFN